jgi:ribonucleoside-diphosphate reductase beta chain|tara:strand:+ start:739 stop:1737 length:999 start_codon:yes stop_codon:yes gene_type:complete
MGYSATTDLSYDKDEILLQKSSSRFVLFPIKYQDIYEEYKKAESSFWTSNEIDLSKDLTDWENLNDNEQNFIKNVIGFFAGSDGIIMENLSIRFMNEIEIPEVRAFYSYQIFNENVHSETYSLLIDTYIKDNEEKIKIFNSIENMPCVGKKAKWAYKWIENKEVNFATRLIAFAIVEGIFFSGSFCAIYWLKKRGLMPGLTFSNELISKDEGTHCYFACLLYSYIKNKLKPEIIYDIIKEAVEIEKEFITESIPCALIGMNAEMMKTYIEFVSDRLLVQLGYEKIWNSSNPFDFMELISLRPKANFFELRVGEYAKSNISENNDNFEINNDF